MIVIRTLRLRMDVVQKSLKPPRAAKSNSTIHHLSRSSTTTGLGGTLFPPAGSGSAVSNVENKNDGKALKETSVPAELFQVFLSWPIETFL